MQRQPPAATSRARIRARAAASRPSGTAEAAAAPTRRRGSAVDGSTARLCVRPVARSSLSYFSRLWRNRPRPPRMTSRAGGPGPARPTAGLRTAFAACHKPALAFGATILGSPKTASCGWLAGGTWYRPGGQHLKRTAGMAPGALRVRVGGRMRRPDHPLHAHGALATPVGRSKIVDFPLPAVTSAGGRGRSTDRFHGRGVSSSDQGGVAAPMPPVR